MKKIVTILGARPQFVKAAVLSRIIESKGEIEEVIVHTGQHFDPQMSAVFFEQMNIPEPKYNLDINKISHGAMTGRMLERIEKILIDENPDAVVVYGDTNSTIAGALAAKKLHLKVAHIEAGLRSYNMEMPEEINRIVTDRIADLLSCPTDIAVQNLQAEGFDNLENRVIKHGDIMKDAVAYYRGFSEERSSVIDALSLQDKPFVLATIHRQENTATQERLREVFAGLDALTASHQVVLPLHPRTKKCLAYYGIETQCTLIDPVGYFDMLELLKHCSLVVTDSGGLQKEAFFNQKCCIVVRDETEWKELVNHGFAVVTGSNVQAILQAKETLLAENKDFEIDLYGHDVGEKIYADLVNLIEHSWA